MSKRKGQETPDNMASDTQAEDEGEECRTKENEYEPLKDIIESDQAVEPDAKVVEELKLVPEEEEEEGSDKEKMAIAYATHKRQLVEHTISRRQHQRRQRQRRRK